ncbi:hypothetical protein [Loktanella sp. R86503]|uniref:hypothetical protein n=1 Tax=Loktanella sp. R86503 TaxID=3093847 RepID=UPI0036D8C6CE
MTNTIKIDRDELRRRWAGTESVAEICAAFGVGPSYLRKVAREMKLDKRTHVMGRRSEDLQDTPEIRAMWDAGKPQRSIAAVLGVPDYVVSELAKRCGYPQRATRIGAKSGTFWSDEDKAKAIDMRRQGCTQTEIAVAVDRSVSSVGSVLRAAGLTTRKPVVHRGRDLRAAAPKPKDLSLGGRLRDTKGSYAMLSQIAAKQGWTQTQVQQRYHRAMAGEAVQ